MKKFRVALVLLTAALAVATLPFCSGDDNEITEVGNPTSTATTNGTVAALSSSVDGILSGQAEAALSPEERGSRSRGMRDEDFSCSYDGAAGTTVCNCPLGGTMTTTFTDNGPMMVDQTITFMNEMDMVFNDCTVSKCGEEVPLNGEAHATMTGSISPLAGEGETTTTIATDDPCSGMTSGDQSYGFDMTLTSSGISSHEFSGSICITEPVSFDSLDELQSSFDPDNTCSTNE